MANLKSKLKVGQIYRCNYGLRWTITKQIGAFFVAHASTVDVQYIIDNEGRVLTGGRNFGDNQCWVNSAPDTEYRLILDERKEFEYKRVFKDGQVNNFSSTERVTGKVLKKLHSQTLHYIVKVDGAVSTMTPAQFDALLDTRNIK